MSEDLARTYLTRSKCKCRLIRGSGGFAEGSSDRFDSFLAALCMLLVASSVSCRNTYLVVQVLGSPLWDEIILQLSVARQSCRSYERQ